MDIKFRLLQHEVTRCPETWGMRNECAIFYRIYYILGGEAWYSDGKHEKERFKKDHLYMLPVIQAGILCGDGADIWKCSESFE